MKCIVISKSQQKQIQKLELKILIEFDRICKNNNLHYSIAYGTLLGAIRHKGFIPWDDDIDIYMPREDYLKLETICKNKMEENFFFQNNETDPECFYLFNKIRFNNTIFREAVVASYNIHHGVYIDIFPVDKISKNKIKSFIQYYKFHFFRTGVMSKYILLSARKGRKKLLFLLLRILYFPFPLKWLFNCAQNTAKENISEPSNKMNAINFYSPYKKKDIFDWNIFEKYTTCSFMNKDVSIIEKYDLVLSQLYGDYMKLPSKEEQITRHSIVEIKL